MTWNKFNLNFWSKRKDEQNLLILLDNASREQFFTFMLRKLRAFFTEKTKTTKKFRREWVLLNVFENAWIIIAASVYSILWAIIFGCCCCWWFFTLHLLHQQLVKLRHALRILLWGKGKRKHFSLHAKSRKTTNNETIKQKNKANKVLKHKISYYSTRSFSKAIKDSMPNEQKEKEKTQRRPVPFQRSPAKRYSAASSLFGWFCFWFWHFTLMCNDFLFSWLLWTLARKC